MTRMTVLKGLLFPIIMIASQAHAACDDLWYARNAILDHHGQCFSTPLARASFTTSCGGVVSPDPQTVEKINLIRDREAALGCRVDTGRTMLNIPGIADRVQRIVTQPVASGTESACIGWKSDALELVDTPLARGPVSIAGSAHVGDTLTFSHDDVGRFSYVVVYRDDVYWGQGWVDLSGVDFENQCEFLAG